MCVCVCSAIRTPLCRPASFHIAAISYVTATVDKETFLKFPIHGSFLRSACTALLLVVHDIGGVSLFPPDVWLVSSNEKEGSTCCGNG